MTRRKIQSNQFVIIFEILIFCGVLTAITIDRNWWKEKAMCEAMRRPGYSTDVFVKDLSFLLVLYTMTIALHAFGLAILSVFLRVPNEVHSTGEIEIHQMEYIRVAERTMRCICTFANLAVVLYRYGYVPVVEREYRTVLYPESTTSRINWPFAVLSIGLVCSIIVQIVPYTSQYHYIVSFIKRTT
jgi:hypothetical protein